MLIWAQLHQEASSVDLTVSDSAPTDFSNRLSLFLTGKTVNYRAACVRCAARLFSRLRCFAASCISVASVVFRFVRATVCHCEFVGCVCVWLFVPRLLLPPVLSLFFLVCFISVCCVVSTTCVEMTNECVFHTSAPPALTL